MRKLFFIAIAATLSMIAACGNTSSKDEKSEPKTLGDSISTLMGRVYGAQMAPALQQQSGGKLVKDEFMAGLEKGIHSTDMAQLRQEAISIDAKLKTAKEDEQSKLQSRLTGMGLGTQIRQQFSQYESQFQIKTSPALFVNAFKPAFMAETAPDVTADEKQLESIAKRLDQIYSASLRKEAEANEKAGAEYIKAQMAADKSIKITESGLAYKVVKQGKGAKVGDSQTAQVKYVGKHINGTVFDDGGGQTAEFSPSQVVPGFGEGLKLMNPGSKYVLYIPGKLGYGENGTPGGPIGPNETLVFEVELVGVK